MCAPAAPRSLLPSFPHPARFTYGRRVRVCTSLSAQVTHAHACRLVSRGLRGVESNLEQLLGRDLSLSPVPPVWARPMQERAPCPLPWLACRRFASARFEAILAVGECFEMSCAHVLHSDTTLHYILPGTFRPNVLNVWLRVLGAEAVDDAIGSVPVVGHEDGRCP